MDVRNNSRCPIQGAPGLPFKKPRVPHSTRFLAWVGILHF